MPYIITAPKISAISETTKKNKQQNKQEQKIAVRTEYPKLKTPSNNFKMQSDKTLTTQFQIFLNSKIIILQTKKFQNS